VFPILLLLLTSCAPVDSFLEKHFHAFRAVPAPEASSPEGLESALAAAKSHLDEGQFETALNEYGSALGRYPGHRQVEEAYLDALEETYSASALSLDQKDFLAAGTGYKLLLTQFGHLAGLTHRLSFGEGDLRLHLDECHLVLSKTGLSLYREGKLEEAVTVWTGLLSFDPQNQEIRKAVETATIQLEGLEEGGPEAKDQVRH
jgi:tetratricopeptide (TPR) repeat protein